jgi:mycofactocin precursor
MSGQIATAEAATETSAETRPPASAAAGPGQPAGTAGTAPEPDAQLEAQPEVTIQDVLVEDVSIDGMCGVY